MFARDGGDVSGEAQAVGFASGAEDFYGGFVVVEIDLVHGHALEEGVVVAGGFQAGGGELRGDVLCGALVGFGAGVAAFHGVVGESRGLSPPRGGGGVRFGGRLSCGCRG